MTDKRDKIVSKIKQPFVIAGLLIVVAIGIVLVNQTSHSSLSTIAQADAPQADTPSKTNPFHLKPTDSAGQNMPRIMQNMNNSSQASQEGAVNAPGLDSLVKGLEDKVAADPRNVNNKILLAQTYNELGMQDKALTIMQAMRKEQPNDGRTNLILVSILSRSNDQNNLKESLSILDKLSQDKTVTQYLVNLYKGDSLMRMKDQAGALKYWKLALKDMPASDNRRAIVEQRIANLSQDNAGKDGDNTKDKSNKS